jgi:hypothetical protein
MMLCILLLCDIFVERMPHMCDVRLVSVITVAIAAGNEQRPHLT